MPAAARALATGGVDPASVQATGPAGRMLKEDVQRAANAAPAPQAPAGAKSAPAGEREEELVPMTPLRKRIAQRLVEAQATAAILTTFNEVDMSQAMALRKAHQERFVERYGIKLGFMSFFVKASIEALKRVPTVNAEVRGDAIAYRNYYDIGIAVGGGKGLVVPVVRNAERLSFSEVEQKIAELGARAKDNKLTLEELTGGTFTISNGGIYGSLLSTPILNPPQSGILGLHAIQDRAVVVGGQIVVRPMMYVALSYDHRVIDGREAVTFLKTVKECVEDPARMLLEV
jgi:2-oxoglutarate dehydrogenase E2 component (dihydrolipoamide succinyltransferase)